MVIPLIFPKVPQSPLGILQPQHFLRFFGDEETTDLDRPAAALRPQTASQVGSSFLDGALDRFAEYLGVENWRQRPAAGLVRMGLGFPRTWIYIRGYNNDLGDGCW